MPKRKSHRHEIRHHRDILIDYGHPQYYDSDIDGFVAKNDLASREEREQQYLPDSIRRHILIRREKFVAKNDPPSQDEDNRRQNIDALRERFERLNRF